MDANKSEQLQLSDDAYYDAVDDLQTDRFQPEDDNDTYYDANYDLQQAAASIDWLQLPDDVLMLIIQRLDVIDRTRMSFVCKSWRLLLANQKCTPILPWLMLSPKINYNNDSYQFLPWSKIFPRRHSSKQISFFDMSQGKIHNFNLPKSLDGGWCFGSSKGWLLIAKGSKKKPEIFLLNPISGKIIRLPSITTVPFYDSYVEELDIHLNKHQYDFSAFINKLELYFWDYEEEEDVSSATIVAILGYKVLATCKHKDGKWTIVFQFQERDGSNLLDVSFHDATLYVLYEIETLNADNINSNVIAMLASDITSGLSKRTIPVKLVLDVPPDDDDEEEYIDVLTYNFTREYVESSIRPNNWYNSFFVESNGELLIIHSVVDVIASDIMPVRNGTIDYDDTHTFDYFQTRKFQVCKLDHSRATLDDDQLIFIGGIGPSSSLSAKDFNSDVQGNCIYFMDNADHKCDSDFKPEVVRECGVYSIKNGRIKRCFPSTEYPASMSWFTPHFNFA